jgi:pimeloyl-ACP methyl ester carboxylesterase
MSISSQLGREHRVDIPEGAISYRDCGDGSPIVFVHGVGVNGDLWRQVVPRLVSSHRCITPDLPWGSHSIPLEPDADLSLPGMARITANFLEALDLDDVAIVANDTGGAVAQALVARHPDRIARLVLTSCDAFDKFPPTPQKYLLVMARSPLLTWIVAYTAQFKPIQRLPTAYGFVTLRAMPADIMRSYTDPVRLNPGVRRDFRACCEQSTRSTHSRPRLGSPTSTSLRSCCGLRTTGSSLATTDGGWRNCCRKADSSSSRAVAPLSPKTSPTASSPRSRPSLRRTQRGRGEGFAAPFEKRTPTNEFTHCGDKPISGHLVINIAGESRLRCVDPRKICVRPALRQIRGRAAFAVASCADVR